MRKTTTDLRASSISSAVISPVSFAGFSSSIPGLTNTGSTVALKIGRNRVNHILVEQLAILPQPPDFHVHGEGQNKTGYEGDDDRSKE